MCVLLPFRKGEPRRGRWPKASLYKGLASDDDRRPRSVGRDYAHLSLDLSPLPRAGGQRPPLVDGPSAFVEAHMGMRALSLSGDFRLTTRLVSRVGWRLTMMSGARGTAIGSARRKSRGELCRGRPIIAPQPCIRRALRPEPMMHSCASAA